MTEKRKRVAVERVLGGTLVLLPSDPKTGYVLPRIFDGSRYEHLVRSITYRKHREVCTGRGRN